MPGHVDLLSELYRYYTRENTFGLFAEGGAIHIDSRTKKVAGETGIIFL